MVMWKIKNLFSRIKNVYRWIPVLWKDQDWDHWFIYQILITKLKHQEHYIRTHGHLENGEEVCRVLRRCIYLADMVQNEKYLDDCFNQDDIKFDDCIQKHNNARKELFELIEKNIETWWD